MLIKGTPVIQSPILLLFVTKWSWFVHENIQFHRDSLTHWCLTLTGIPTHTLDTGFRPQKYHSMHLQIPQHLIIALKLLKKLCSKEVGRSVLRWSFCYFVVSLLTASRVLYLWTSLCKIAAWITSNRLRYSHYWNPIYHGESFYMALGSPKWPLEQGKILRLTNRWADGT